MVSQKDSNISTPRLRNMNRSPANSLKMQWENDALREELLGKNTIQAVEILARTYEATFEGAGGSAQEVRGILNPYGRAMHWEELDYNICQFCKYLRVTYGVRMGQKDSLLGEYYAITSDIQLQHNFWDDVRYVLYSLPRRLDYKVDEQGFNTTYNIANFRTCSLCWRSVLRWPSKRPPLCHIHAKWDKRGSAYRARLRLQKKYAELWDGVRETVPNKHVVKFEMGKNPKEYYAELVLDKHGTLGHVAKYLHSLHVPLDNPTDIARALDEPLSFLEEDAVKTLWSQYFEDFGSHFNMMYLRLVGAETWLAVESRTN